MFFTKRDDHTCIYMCVYIYVAPQVFFKGDSMILERRNNNIKINPRCFRELDSNELIQPVNVIFCEADADEKDV